MGSGVSSALLPFVHPSHCPHLPGGCHHWCLPPWICLFVDFPSSSSSTGCTSYHFATINCPEEEEEVRGVQPLLGWGSPTVNWAIWCGLLIGFLLPSSSPVRSTTSGRWWAALRGKQAAASSCRRKSVAKPRFHLVITTLLLCCCLLSQLIFSGWVGDWWRDTTRLSIASGELLRQATGPPLSWRTSWTSLGHHCHSTSGQRSTWFSGPQAFRPLHGWQTHQISTVSLASSTKPHCATASHPLRKRKHIAAGRRLSCHVCISGIDGSPLGSRYRSSLEGDFAVASRWSRATAFGSGVCSYEASGWRHGGSPRECFGRSFTPGVCGSIQR